MVDENEAPVVGGGAPVVWRKEWVTERVPERSVAFRTFESVHAGGPVSYHIALPDRYASVPDARFPVVYWLHGSGGGLAGIPRLAAFFRQAMERGDIPPVIVVFVNGLPNGMYCDWKDGSVRVERVIVDDLVPHIDATYRTMATREGRILDGFSMGGYGAARIGFSHPGLFGAVSMLGAGPVQRELADAPRASAARREALLEEVYGGDPAYFESVGPWRLAEVHAAEIRTRGLAIRMVIGSRDETLPANEALHRRLEALGIEHEYTVVPGVAHEPMRLLMALRTAQWAWYRAVLGRVGA